MATGFRGVVFDVDGVLVDSPHERAWRDGLRQLMENEWSDIRDQTSYSPEAFTPQVYQTQMSGMPRYKGVQAALEYFEVPDAEERAQEYGDRKQEMIVELIEQSEFYAYPDALRFVLECKNAGIKMVTASSSKNANAFLERIRLDEFCEQEGLSYDFIKEGYTILDILDANVSGRDFEQGKPDPEIDLLVARELGVKPEECLVIEDSPAGVQAALAAGMEVIAVTTELTRQKFRDTDLLDRCRVVEDPRMLPNVVRRLIEGPRWKTPGERVGTLEKERA